MSALAIAGAAGKVLGGAGDVLKAFDRPNTPQNIWYSPHLAKSTESMALDLPAQRAQTAKDIADWRTAFEGTMPQAQRYSTDAQNLALANKDYFARFNPLDLFQTIQKGTTDAYTGAVLNPTLAASDRAQKAASALYGIQPGGYRSNQDALAKNRIYGQAAGVANLSAGNDFQRVLDAIIRSKGTAQQYAGMPTSIMDATTARLLTPAEVKQQSIMNDVAMLLAQIQAAQANTAGWEQRPTTTGRWAGALQAVGKSIGSLGGMGVASPKKEKASDETEDDWWNIPPSIEGQKPSYENPNWT